MLYAIVSNGELLELCEEPRYIRLNPKTNTFVQCSEEDAEGVAAGGEAYNFDGSNAFEGKPVAYINKVDGARYTFESHKRIGETEKNVNDVETSVCELDMNTSDRLDEIENAILELDMARVSE